MVPACSGVSVRYLLSPTVSHVPICMRPAYILPTRPLTCGAGCGARSRGHRRDWEEPGLVLTVRRPDKDRQRRGIERAKKAPAITVLLSLGFPCEAELHQMDGSDLPRQTGVFCSSSGG